MQKQFVKSVYLIALIDVYDSLRHMADDEDHDHPGEKGYHGLVPPEGEQDGGETLHIFIINSPLSLAYVVMQQSVPLHGLYYPVVECCEQEDGDHTCQDMDND